ncbi:hypothetical protein B0T10DRAFT_461259 [Thelonectria olida]|uniref:Uncharacterized protein n=1 Tax=Thelonectria olida TaxID=1576542 RepID=A0A9P8W190_9HYPO|nr:hypothetical protein B0T10DRAFT_461259 [Thelonectria olida]
MCLGDLEHAPWCKLSPEGEKEDFDEHDEDHESNESDECHENDEDHETNQASEKGRLGPSWSIITPSNRSSSMLSPSSQLENEWDGRLKIPTRFSAQGIMAIRRDLAKLAKWRGLAAEEAIRLTRAIKVAMNTLFPKGGADVKKRSAQARGSQSTRLVWSLNGMGRAKSQGHKTVASDLLRNDDTWLRAKGPRSKPAPRLIDHCKQLLKRDLRLWMPRDEVGIVKATQGTLGNMSWLRVNPDGSRQLEVETCRVVGRGLKKDKTFPTRNWTLLSLSRHISDRKWIIPTKNSYVLAVESHDPLEKLYAKDMFCAFMWAAAEKMNQSIDHHWELQAPDYTAIPQEAWKFFTLRSKRLSKLAQDIQDSGSHSETYFRVVAILAAYRQALGIHVDLDTFETNSTESTIVKRIIKTLNQKLRKVDQDKRSVFEELYNGFQCDLAKSDMTKVTRLHEEAGRVQTMGTTTCLISLSILSGTCAAGHLYIMPIQWTGISSSLCSKIAWM